MRSIHDWFGAYSADHQHPANRTLHWICVPIITWCVVAALWVVPVPAGIGRAGFWAFVGMFVAYLFYARLSRPIAYGMALAFIACGLLAELGYRALGVHGLLMLAGSLFVLAWIGQFVGHAIEGRRPSFLTDLQYLLIGPAWLMGKTLRRLGVNW